MFKMTKKQANILSFAFVAATAVLFAVNPTCAAVQGAAKVKEIVDQMIDIIGMIFVAAGVLLSTYSVGQLIMAFKNEDPDSKSRASTMLVVSIVLIAFPAIVKGLNLTANIAAE